MSKTKQLISSMFAFGLTAGAIMLAGCVTAPAATNITETVNGNSDIPVEVVNTTDNTNVNANLVQEDDNVTVDVGDSNTDTATDTAVDTSDWLTYTNEEYGFSFKYPKDWGEVMVDKIGPDQYIQGTKTALQFSKDSSTAIQGRSTAIINIETLDYELSAPTDGSDIPINNIDFTHTNDELASELKRYETTNLVVNKITVSGVQGLLLNETATNLGGEEYKLIYYIIPKYNSDNSMNFIIYTNGNTASILEKVVHTIVFSES